MVYNNYTTKSGGERSEEVTILLCNLKAEMARRSISALDIAKEIGRTDRSVREKISGRSQFSMLEAATVRDKFFPGFSLEYLFTDAHSSSTNTAAS